MWILGHPYPAGWDEAEYNNRMLDDVAAVKEDGLCASAGLLLQSDGSRPPAFRALALPVALLLNVSPVMLRLVALAFFPVTLVFVYLAAARVTGRLAGATAVTEVIPGRIAESPSCYLSRVDQPVGRDRW
jgi:hypothetical protein